MIKSLKSNRISFIFILIFMIIFITNPKIYMNSCLNGLNVWFFNVLPALFPFLIATKMLTLLSINKHSILDKITKKIFNVNNGGIIVFLSLLSGYPVGSKLVCDAYNANQLDENSAKKLFTICSLSGPMFIIGTVGIACFNSIKIGYSLLLCHYLGGLTNSLIFTKLTKVDNYNKQLPIQQKKDNIFSTSMLDSVTAILLVGGYIVFAYVIIDMLNYLNIIDFLSQIIATIPLLSNQQNSISAFLNGLVEMTRGIIDLSTQNQLFVLPLISFLLGFGGLSIFLQTTSFMNKLKIKKTTILFQKLCQGLWSCFFAILVFIIF